MTWIVSLCLPLVALLLWWPVAFASARQRRWHVGLSLALALSLLAMVAAWRSNAVSYAVVSWLQVALGWVLVVLALCLVWVVIRLLAWGASRLLLGPARAAFWHRARLNQVVVALIMAAGGLGIYNGLTPPSVRERDLAVAGLPAEMAGLRVAVLSDIHASPVKGAWRNQAIVSRVMAAKPDVIVLPGDMVDGEVEDSAAAVAPLGKLAAPYGVWLAPGNHEYYHGYQRWMAHFRQLGLGVLENQTTRMAINGRELAISGIGDLAALKRSSFMRGGLAPDLQAVNNAAEGADFHILLAHQPKQARASAASGRVNLQLSGHTHGGHIIGFDRWAVAPANDGYVRGPYHLAGGMTLFVSAGAGQWDGFTVRLGVPSAIDILRLRPAAP